MHPKSDDSLYMYRVGQATGLHTQEDARKAAYEDALATISKEILSAVKVEGADAKLTSGFTIRSAEIIPESIYFEKHGIRYSCWVQVSYPLVEKRKLVEQVALGEKVKTGWVEAQSAFNRGDFAGAEQRLNAAIRDYAGAVGVGFKIESAKLLLAKTYEMQNNKRKARTWYTDVQNSSVSPEREEAAKRLEEIGPLTSWEMMNDRWAGRKVAVLCAIRDGKGLRRFVDLTNLLLKGCGEAELTAIDISKELALDATAAFFDETEFASACRAASGQGAGLVLAVLFDIDPARRGKTRVEVGVTVPELDSDVRFFVVRVDTGASLYNGQFKEVAGNQSESHLAERAASIMIRKYLVPECPAVGGAGK